MPTTVDSRTFFDDNWCKMDIQQVARKLGATLAEAKKAAGVFVEVFDGELHAGKFKPDSETIREIVRRKHSVVTVDGKYVRIDCAEIVDPRG